MPGLKPTDRGLMRAMNTKLVLDAVRGSATTSQADLIKSTRLSTGTIVSIVRELREQGLLAEVGQGASRGGRKPTLLRLNPAAARVLSCRVGSDSATTAVLDLGANILDRRELRLEPQLGPAPFLAALATCLQEQVRAFAPHGDGIVGLGLSLHGPVDAARGVMLLSEHLGWRDVPFRSELERVLGLPVCAEAETRAIALAEQCWGAARGAHDFVLIELDSGIGMVQVLEGRLCRGSHSLAGELGFTVWEAGSGRHTGRQAPVLEQVASLRALCQWARNSPTSPGPDAPRRPPPDALPEAWLRWLVDLADAGHAPARQALDDAVHALGLAVANVINLLDPELVLLTGRLLSGADGALNSRVRAKVQGYLLGSKDRVPRIEPAVLGPDAALLGAAWLVIDRFLSVDSLARGRGPG